jgi:nucleoside-diphosphate-sugar epimerase
MTSDRTKTVLVTGATGFVGREVCARLERDGRGVRLAVRREPGPSRVVVGDIGAKTDWRAALEGVDSVVHLAARVHVMHETAADPDAAFRQVNVDGTRRLAEQAAEAGVRRFVFVSSVKVSGEQTALGRPFRPDDAPAPADPYGRSKRDAELALGEIAAASSMSVARIRPPLVYGPGVRANFLAMMRWVRRGVPLPLASVNNRRSLVFVGNLADLVCRCIDHPRAAGELFFASDGEDLSTPELLRRLAVALHVRARLFPMPVPLLAAGARAVGKRAIFDRLCGSLQVDVEPTRRLLDWTPPFSVDAALSKTAESHLGAGAR